MASVREASDGCCEAREISQADVPMRAIEAPIAPAPSREAWARRRRAAWAIPRVPAHRCGVVAHAGTSAGGSSTTRSASAARAGRWATISAVRPLDQRADRREHVRLGLVVEAGGRLVQQEQRRVAHEGPRQREALALPGREAGAALAEGRVGAQGETRAPRRSSPAASSGRRHLGVGGIGPAEPDVVGDRAREQVRSLGHPADVPPPVGQVEVGEVHAAERDGARVREPSPRITESRVDFAAPARAGERHGLARLDGQRGVVQRRQPRGPG